MTALVNEQTCDPAHQMSLPGPSWDNQSSWNLELGQ